MNPLKRWGGIGVVAVGGWLGTDLLLHLGHGIGHGLLDLGLTGAGLLWLQGRLGRGRSGLTPTSVQGWLSRCDRLLEQFKVLDDDERHAAVFWYVGKEQFQRLQSARRSADTDDGES